MIRGKYAHRVCGFTPDNETYNKAQEGEVVLNYQSPLMKFADSKEYGRIRIKPDDLVDGIYYVYPLKEEKLLAVVDATIKLTDNNSADEIQVLTCRKTKTLEIRAQSGMEVEEQKPVTTEQHQLTAIVTKSETQDADNLKPYVHFNRDIDPFPNQGLGKVLSRMYRIATFTWNGSDAMNTQVLVLNFPKALLDVATNLTDKINHFHWFRANVKLTFHVAGTMYHYGRLMAAILPFTKGGATQRKYSDVWVMSTLDHILISPDTNTVTSIEIPFMGQATHWPHDLTSDEGYFGSLCIRVLHPLTVQNSQTTPSIPVSVFAEFVQPEVMGPTLHAQSGNEDIEGMRVMTDTEQTKKSKGGIISKAMDFGSRVASACVLIPGVGTVAGVVSAGLFFGAKIARAFGFDKPDNVQSFQPVYLTTTNCMATGNGMNTANPLTMITDNNISSKPEDFQSNQIETDIGHLIALPGLFLTGSFNSSSTNGTVIAKWHNTPHLAPATTAIIQWIPCSAVASNFLFWRGDMKYVIFFSCSKFHVCKVRIAFHPTFSEIVLSPEGEGDYQSEVYDICGDTTLEFRIPYMANVPYKIPHLPNNATWTEDQYAGAISVSIVNPIASVPGTTTSTIYFAIYAAADPRMEFNAPCESNMGEAGHNMLIEERTVAFAPPFIAQSGKETKDNNTAPMKIFQKDFPYLGPCKSTRLQRVCFGEEVNSILDLMHRFVYTGLITLNLNVPVAFRYPEKYTDGVDVWPNQTAFDLFRDWFLFARGGLHWKFIPSTNVEEGVTFNMDGTVYATNAYDIDNIFLPTNLPYGRIGTVCENYHYKPTLEVCTGQYGSYPYWWREKDYPTEYLNASYGGYNGVKINYEGMNNQQITLKTFFAIKDDCSFGYPRGCPKSVFTPFPGLESKSEHLEVVKTRRQMKESQRMSNIN